MFSKILKEIIVVSAACLALICSGPLFCASAYPAIGQAVPPSSAGGDAEHLERIMEEKFESAEHLNAEGRYAEAGLEYLKLLSWLYANRVGGDEAMERVCLGWLENSLELKDIGMIGTLIQAPVQYSLQGQIRHAILFSRIVRTFMPDALPDVPEWLEYADDTLKKLKSRGEDVLDLELALLNEMGAVCGSLNVPGWPDYVIGRLEKLGSRVDPGCSNWPADAYLHYSMSLMSEDRMNAALYYARKVVNNKVEFNPEDAGGAVALMAYLAAVCDMQPEISDVLDRWLTAIDREMSWQGVVTPQNNFYLMYDPSRYMDAFALASAFSYADSDCILYDAALTLGNMVFDLRNDLKSYADTCGDGRFRYIYQMMRHISYSGHWVTEPLYIEKTRDIANKLYRPHRYSWKDVKEALQPGEAAVEFISVPRLLQTESYFAALVVRKDSFMPEVVQFCRISEVDSLLRTGVDLYRRFSGKAYDLVWKPLERSLDGCSTVYYALKGSLNLINMDALQADGEGTLLSEKYDMRLVSSTAVLTRGRPLSEQGLDFGRGITLFGGLDYSLTQEEWRTAAAFADSLKSFHPDFLVEKSDYGIAELFADVPSDTSRSGISYLRHSMREIGEIGSLFSDPVIFSGADGVEENFRMPCTGNVLHLATHAFIFGKEEVWGEGRLEGLDFDYVSTSEIDAMKRCGLLFSGAGSTVEGKPAVGAYDGLIFGDDIAARDFSDLDLVVLSGCGTALGDVNDDGIFGLQRAFKLAGAGTLVMSLWNVNDESSAFMMTEFYRNMASGDTKRDAFLKARDAVREKYRDPYYWAPFIMLD